MILNPIRLVRCALIERQLDRNLKARRTARHEGRSYVAAHYRRKV